MTFQIELIASARNISGSFLSTKLAPHRLLPRSHIPGSSSGRELGEISAGMQLEFHTIVYHGLTLNSARRVHLANAVAPSAYTPNYGLRCPDLSQSTLLPFTN